MADFFSELEETSDRLILRPQHERHTYKDYAKYKVGKSGYLWAYWDAGKHTKSGFYRDCLIYVGTKYQKCKIERISDREIVIYK